MNERFARAGRIARVDLAHEPDFALGPIEVRPARREVVGAHLRETVEPRVMRVFVALARAKGEIVSRDDLIESCWEGVVVGEDAINRCIGRLRKLAEATGNVFAVETVSRVGYRLCVAEGFQPSFEAWSETPAPAGVGASETITAVPARFGGSHSRLRYLTLQATFALIIVVSAGAWLWRDFIPAHKRAELASTSIAVLPFVNLSGDPGKEYFSDGFSEELVNDLSNVPSLRVASRTSSFAFKGRNQDIRNIARALNVHTIVEGSIREAGDRIRVTVQVVDGVAGYHLLSRQYDRSLVDILSLQADVARDITVVLIHKLLPHLSSASPQRINPEVYRLYLKAREQLNEYWGGGYGRAVTLLKQVVAKQPNFADGFAALARAAINFSAYDLEHSNSDIGIANDSVQRALLLDPANIEAREVRTALELYGWNWSAATQDIRTLRMAAPNNMRVLAGSRAYYDQMGLPDAAIAIMQRAHQLDPLSDEPKLIILADLFNLSRYEDTIKLARSMVATKPKHMVAQLILCEAYARIGRVQEAREIESELRGFSSASVAMQSEECEFEIAVARGELKAARTILSKWEAGFPDKFVFARDIGDAYVELHEFDKASDWYQRAYERREAWFYEATYWPPAAIYRATARWKALMQQPQFREWQAEHDKIASEIASRRGAP